MLLEKEEEKSSKKEGFSTRNFEDKFQPKGRKKKKNILSRRLHQAMKCDPINGKEKYQKERTKKEEAMSSFQRPSKGKCLNQAEKRNIFRVEGLKWFGSEGRKSKHSFSANENSAKETLFSISSRAQARALM